MAGIGRLAQAFQEDVSALIFDFADVCEGGFVTFEVFITFKAVNDPFYILFVEFLYGFSNHI